MSSSETSPGGAGPGRFTGTGPSGIDVAAAIGHPSARWGSVPDLLDAMATARPDAPAVSVPGEVVTYGELAAVTVRAAVALRALGVEPGDRVGVFLAEASVTYVAIAVGIMRLGAVIVPVNARNREGELRHVAAHAGMSLLVTETAFRDLVAQAALPDACIVTDASGIVAGERDAPAGCERWARAGRRDHVALLVYTSGTTGAPKGCLHSHSTLLAEGENCASRLELGPDDRFWTPLPLFHCGGWQTLLAAFSRGACFSHVGRFRGDVALRQLRNEQCTHAFPAFELIWSDVLRETVHPGVDLGALRRVMNVGPPEHMTQMQDRVPHAVQVSCMGSTESCGSICIGAADDPHASRMATSGAPLPGAEVRVVEPGSRTEVPVGATGELLFRGVTAFLGYYRDPGATARAFDADGWFRSGDLVRREDHGGVSFVSRMTDMLKVGGENVAPGEVEGHLLTHPWIAQAAVVGAPDGRYGEVVAAFVAVEAGRVLTEEDVIGFCRGRIAAFKVPRHVRVVDGFPVTASQKVQKVRLRERIADELGAGRVATPHPTAPPH